MTTSIEAKLWNGRTTNIEVLEFDKQNINTKNRNKFVSTFVAKRKGILTLLGVDYRSIASNIVPYCNRNQ